MPPVAPSDAWVVTATWTIVFDTASTETALRLLERVLRRLDARPGATLRPWGEDRERRAAALQTEYRGVQDRRLLVAWFMAAAETISATWTLDLAPPGGTEAVMEAWTPAEYRRFTLTGLHAASAVLRQGKAGPEEVGTARLLTLPSGVLVRVISDPVP